MAEATQAPAPVEQGTDERSILSRLSAVIDDNPAEANPEPDTKPSQQADEAPAQQPEPAEPAPTEAKDGELTPEDIPDEAAPPAAAGDTFEIVHNGQQHKLSREETIKLAQQGFDYTQKTQAVAERAKAIDAALQRVNEVEQIMPVLAREQAEFAAVQSQLAQWKDVDWVALATQKPNEYPMYRAQYDQLRETAQQAGMRLNQAVMSVQQARQQAQQTQLAQEFQRLTNEYVPEWKDPAKYESGARELSKFLIDSGVAPEQVATLSSAPVVRLALDAMKYRQLLASKQSKSKILQTKPPVAKPGTPNTPQSAAADKEQQLTRRLKKSGSLEDATALYLSRMK